LLELLEALRGHEEGVRYGRDRAGLDRDEAIGIAIEVVLTEGAGVAREIAGIPLRAMVVGLLPTLATPAVPQGYAHHHELLGQSGGGVEQSPAVVFGQVLDDVPEEDDVVGLLGGPAGDHLADVPNEDIRVEL